MVLTNKNVLVTGGAGFIGSNLVESLLESGNTVTCLDNFSTGKRSNIDFFAGNRNFSLVEGDIRDFDTCLNALDGVDIVFHEAALGSVPRSINDPVSTTAVNINGFVNMLFASREKGVERFIYAASSSTYGDSKELPKVEDRIGKPLSPYAITKYVNELFASNFASLYGIKVIGLRYFNVFGRRQDPYGPYAAVIPIFTKMLRNHEAPIINGDGSISRDFTYIDNVIQINHLAGLVNDDRAFNQVYNVAQGERTTLIRLFELLKGYASAHDKKVLGIEPLFGPPREGDIPHSLASIDKAKKLLGYNPSYNVETGLKEAVDWYWKNL